MRGHTIDVWSLTVNDEPWRRKAAGWRRDYMSHLPVLLPWGDRYKFTRLRGRVKHWAETATSPMRPGAPFPILRGAVRLPAEVRLDLVMGPAADEQAEPVAQLLNRAMLRGLI